MSTGPDMTAVLHAWPYGRFIEIQSNLRRKKLYRTNQGSNCLGGSFSNRANIRAQIQWVSASLMEADIRSCSLYCGIFRFRILLEKKYSKP